MDFFLGLVDLAFVGCAVKAVSAAKQKKFMEHQYWMIRHVALGLWVSLQRVMILGFVRGVWLVFFTKEPLLRMNTKGRFFEIQVLQPWLSVWHWENIPLRC